MKNPGGAAGGGKSVYLLAAALQYVDIPGYSAILFRKTFSDLNLPGALIPMSHEWLDPWIDKGLVRWQDKEKRYTFLESGATLSFGYLDGKDDHYRYQGAEFTFVGMDEATQIDPVSYRYLFSRLRRSKNVTAPLRFRATTNPGGVHGDYYYERFFVDNKSLSGKKKRIFLQAGLSDNPHLDSEEYKEALAELDPITRAQLEDGNWEIRAQGDLFDKTWLISINADDIPNNVRRVRFWDLAAVDPKKKKKDKRADWTVGLKLAYGKGLYYIEDIIMAQKSPGDVEKLVYNTAMADGFSCAIRMEEEGGASGIANTERYARYVLPGFNYVGLKPGGNKAERARPVAAACQVGTMYLSNRCRNILHLYSQLEAFPYGANDDVVDALSGAFAYFKPKMGVIAPPPPGRRAHAANNPLGKKSKKTQTLRPNIGHSGSYWRQPMNR